MAKSKRFLYDLDKYTACDDYVRFGMDPLAVGFLQYKQRFETGKVSVEFLAKLLPYCRPENVVNPLPRRLACPLCREWVEVEIDGERFEVGEAEIRVLGEQDIYAAPDILPHLITAHSYVPPKVFQKAVRKSGGVDSAEFRALINALR